MYAANPALREYFTDADDPSVDPMDDDEIAAFPGMEYGTMRQLRPYGCGSPARSNAPTCPCPRPPPPKDLTLVDPYSNR